MLPRPSSQAETRVEACSSVPTIPCSAIDSNLITQRLVLQGCLLVLCHRELGLIRSILQVEDRLVQMVITRMLAEQGLRVGEVVQRVVSLIGMN